MPVTDSFGVWGNLGTITPIPNQWLRFPFDALENNETIRASFECLDFSKIRSYGLLRINFKSGGIELPLPPIKIYPKPGSIRYSFPVPNDLILRGVTYRSFEVMLKLYKSYWGTASSINWSIQLEELWG